MLSLDLLNNEKFLSQIFLFINETLFRFIAITSVIRSISLTSPAVKGDIYLYNSLFSNELFDNLNDWMKFVIKNKTLYEN